MIRFLRLVILPIFVDYQDEKKIEFLVNYK
jgi:hypothetical protein